MIPFTRHVHHGVAGGLTHGGLTIMRQYYCGMLAEANLTRQRILMADMTAMGKRVEKVEEAQEADHTDLQLIKAHFVSKGELSFT